MGEHRLDHTRLNCCPLWFLVLYLFFQYRYEADFLLGTLPIEDLREEKKKPQDLDMFIFDDLLSEVNEINKNCEAKNLEVNLNHPFKEDRNQFIFQDDIAYELGANPYKGITLDLLTDSVFEDEILLLGDDLDAIGKNMDYARIVFASIDKDLIGTSNRLYGNIRKFDYIKYHLNYEGIMVRESVFRKKESLVVSKNELKKGNLNFSLLGSYIISKLKELPFIKNVKIIFVNKQNYNYEGLFKVVTRCENITKALDHLMNKVKMDCHVCSLQVICSEVEKKVNEDFKKE